MPAGALPVLTYHAIDASGGVTATDPSWFAETLAVLAEAGYRAIDLDDWIARGRPDPGRAFAVTFDDGLRSVLRAAEVLSLLAMPATVFLVTDRVGADNDWPGQPSHVRREPLLDWPEVEALEALGLRFAAHGRTHARLDLRDDAGLESEFRGSRDAIEGRLGRPCRLLAYPYGAAPPRVRRAAALHFSAAFGTRLDVATAAQDAFGLARIDAYYLRSRHALDRLASGRCEGWLLARRTLRNARGVAVSAFSAAGCRRVSSWMGF